MPLKKHSFSDDEVPIYDEAVVYRRGEYWQMRMWLTQERKYARFSLRTRNRHTAIDKAKKHYHELKAAELSGKRYFSLTAKQGVDQYIKQREQEVGVAGGIVKGRLGTLKTHLAHWLNYIGRDTKLKEMERTDCENYHLSRSKGKRQVPASITTIANEYSTINAMMNWLYRRGETHIESFDFKKLGRSDKGADQQRRTTFTDNEMVRIHAALKETIAEARKDLTNPNNRQAIINAYYLGFSAISGLRRGEQLQMRWQDVSDTEHREARVRKADLVHIVVRGETSKVRQTRKLVIKDEYNYYGGLLLVARDLYFPKLTEYKVRDALADYLMFSYDGRAPLTPRAIGYHFDKLMEKAKIELGTRNLVPYSFRHYFITKRVNSNLPAAAVAEMCGTSITQIERTYYHTTFDKMISNALADYEYKDGILVPKL
jgi:integrase